MAYVCLFCASFSIFLAVPFIDKCEKKITRYALKLISLRSNKLLNQITWLSYLCAVFLYTLISSGLLGFKGTQVSALDSSSFQALWYPFVGTCLSILAIIPVVIFKLSEKKWFKHLFLIVSFIIGIYVSFTIGRRALIYQLVLSIYSYILICLAVDNKLPSIKPKTILFSFLVASFVPQLLVFFQYIRTLNIMDLSLINLYSLYLQFIQTHSF